MVYMPFGPGYVYVKSKKNRDDVAKDIQHQTELVFKSFMVRQQGSTNMLC
ncbi:hypothetical protein OESDEN_15999 [Oesophagostomum dentatum]|uniref:Uncharacterized protein n=1 Tax=Oesophagostomum dentatum TaxID=61180 RepID=A0A0B1SK78_OESDE|nr:hypothetical protein OESDEN_15999 [Oesophagostomum dentatum]